MVRCVAQLWCDDGRALLGAPGMAARVMGLARRVTRPAALSVQLLDGQLLGRRHSRGRRRAGGRPAGAGAGHCLLHAGGALPAADCGGHRRRAGAGILRTDRTPPAFRLRVADGNRAGCSGTDPNVRRAAVRRAVWGRSHSAPPQLSRVGPHRRCAGRGSGVYAPLQRPGDRPRHALSLHGVSAPVRLRPFVQHPATQPGHNLPQSQRCQCLFQMGV